MRPVFPSFRPLLPGVLLLVLPGSVWARSAAGADDVEQLKGELVNLQKEMAALSARIDALQAGSPAPAEAAPGAAPAVAAAEAALPPPGPEPSAPVAAAEVPPGAAGAAGPSGTLPVYGNVSAGSKIFNPDIAAIGDFIGAVGTSPGNLQPSLQLHEAEVSFQAIVDPYARADFIFTYGPDEVGIEEAYATFPTLPAGLLAKVGKTRDVFGKVDPQHNHTLAFADRPQVTENLTGGEDGLANPGVTLARLIPNPWVFLEATGQLFGGANRVFDAPSPSDVSFVGHLRAYRDLGEAANLELGGSYAYGHNNAGPSDYTRLLGADLTFRHRSPRRAIYHRFQGRTEFVWSRREEPGAVRDAFGFYAQAEYQFARRWYVAGRYDYSGRADFPDIIDKGGSLALTYWPSEFSQIRSQYRYIRSSEGLTTSELLFQLQFAIGAHGAHPF